MAVYKFGKFSDFNGCVAPRASASFSSQKGTKWYLDNSPAFCLSSSFTGKVSFCGGDLFAMGVFFEGLGNKDVGTFGLPWDDVVAAFEAEGLVETDEAPMVESAWFDQLCADFTWWVLSKL